MTAMSMLMITALSFAANQGAALRLTFPDGAGVKSVEIVWENKRVPAVLSGGMWKIFLGVDLDTKPGKHSAVLMMTRQDGSVDKRDLAIEVERKKYPTTELKVEEKYVELNKTDLARANRESNETEGIYATISNEVLWDGPFVIPIPGGTGTNFGHRRVFNGEPRAPHAGADLHAGTGTPVHSTNRGRVVLAKSLFFTGNTVILDHGMGIYSLYAHLSRINVKRGDLVSSGQLVGLAGATGRVTGPHLHWGMRVQGARVDPFTLVDEVK